MSEIFDYGVCTPYSHIVLLEGVGYTNWLPWRRQASVLSRGPCSDKCRQPGGDDGTGGGGVAVAGGGGAVSLGQQPGSAHAVVALPGHVGMN